MFIGAMASKPLMVVSASNVSGSDSGFATHGIVVSENTPDPVITYGSDSYSYLWERVSGDSPTISSASVANPSWTEDVTDGDNSVSTWRVTVTDTQTGESASTTITVTLIWANLS